MRITSPTSHRISHSQNKRILELEEERTRLAAQLKHAMGNTALAEALQLAKKKEQEIEAIKQKTVVKFKARHIL
jgi:hypothetical protein